MDRVAPKLADEQGTLHLRGLFARKGFDQGHRHYNADQGRFKIAALRVPFNVSSDNPKVLISGDRDIWLTIERQLPLLEPYCHVRPLDAATDPRKKRHKLLVAIPGPPDYIFHSRLVCPVSTAG